MYRNVAGGKKRAKDGPGSGNDASMTEKYVIAYGTGIMIKC